MSADPSVEQSTKTEEYAERLKRLGGAWWKRILPVQAPYRWHIRRLRLGKTLDVGCGTGRNLRYLRSGVGVDHNQRVVEAARARGLEAYTPDEFRSSGRANPESYDSLLFAHVLEHMTERKAQTLIESYLPYLRPGGRIVMRTPQERGFSADPTHVEFLDFERLRFVCSEVGLTVERSYSFPLPRWAGRLFPYNEFVLIASAPRATSRSVTGADDGVALASRSGWLRAGIRLAIGVGVIALLFWQGDVAAIGHALATASPLLIATGLLLNVGLIVVSALRWRVFLEALQIRLAMGTAVRLTLVGSFFNAFLPTGVGGDAYKAIRVRAANTNLATSFATVILDRIAGIATLAMIAVPAAIAAILGSGINPLVFVSLAVSTAILLLAGILLMLGQDLVGGGRSTWFGIRPRVRRVLDAAARGVRTPGTIRRSITLGLVGQILGIAGFVSLSWSLDLGIPLVVVVLGLLNATVASALPITVNGLGIREGIWVWTLALYGVNRGDALAYAVLVLGVALATSAVGGVVYAVAGGDLRVPEGVAEGPGASTANGD